jgi:hypothetical protein
MEDRQNLYSVTDDPVGHYKRRQSNDGRCNLRWLRDRGRPVPSRGPSSQLRVFIGNTGEFFFRRKLTPAGSSNPGLDFPPLPLLNLQVIADGLVHKIINRSVGLLRQPIKGPPNFVFQFDGERFGHRRFCRNPLCQVNLGARNRTSKRRLESLPASADARTRRSFACAIGKMKRPASPASPGGCRRWSRSPAPPSPKPTPRCRRRPRRWQPEGRKTSLSGQGSHPGFTLW